MYNEGRYMQGQLGVHMAVCDNPRVAVIQSHWTVSIKTRLSFLARAKLLYTPILGHSWQGKKVQAISATQLFKMNNRTTKNPEFQKSILYVGFFNRDESR